MKSFGPKKSTFMHGLKSAIWAIFQKSADWLDWPCPFSAAVHFRSQDFFLFSILIFIYFFKYETIVIKNACCLVIQIQIQALCNGIWHCLKKHRRLLHSERNSILRDEATLNQISNSSAPHWTVLDTLLFMKYSYQRRPNLLLCDLAFFDKFWAIDF